MGFDEVQGEVGSGRIRNDEYERSRWKPDNNLDIYLPGVYLSKVENELQKRNMFGRLLALEDLEAISRNRFCATICSIIIQFCSAHWSISRSIYFVLVDVKQISIFCCRLDQLSYAIVVPTGLLSTLERISMVTMATEPISNLFIPDRNFPVFNTNNYPNYEDSNFNSVLMSFGKEYLEHSLGIFGGALATIIFHEVHHIMNGHLDLKYLVSIGALREADWLFEPNEIHLTVEAMELDADSGAAVGLGRMSYGGTLVPTQWIKYSKSLEDLINFLSVSACLGFMLDDLNALLHNELNSNNSHRPGRVRVSTILDTIMIDIKQNGFKQSASDSNEVDTLISGVFIAIMSSNAIAISKRGDETYMKLLISEYESMDINTNKVSRLSPSHTYAHRWQ